MLLDDYQFETHLLRLSPPRIVGPPGRLGQVGTRNSVCDNLYTFSLCAGSLIDRVRMPLLKIANLSTLGVGWTILSCLRAKSMVRVRALS